MLAYLLENLTNVKELRASISMTDLEWNILEKLKDVMRIPHGFTILSQNPTYCPGQIFSLLDRKIILAGLMQNMQIK